MIRKYRWQDAKNVKKYALKVYYHIALIISIYFKKTIKININNKKLKLYEKFKNARGYVFLLCKAKRLIEV